MWINNKKLSPSLEGAYTVFGTINKGTEHELKTKFTAYWDTEINEWTDKDSEDLIGINDAVEYWFDFTDITDPFENINEKEKLLNEFDKLVYETENGELIVKWNNLFNCAMARVLLFITLVIVTFF